MATPPALLTVVALSLPLARANAQLPVAVDSVAALAGLAAQQPSPDSCHILTDSAGVEVPGPGPQRLCVWSSSDTTARWIRVQDARGRVVLVSLVWRPVRSEIARARVDSLKRSLSHRFGAARACRVEGLLWSTDLWFLEVDLNPDTDTDRPDRLWSVVLHAQAGHSRAC